MQTARPQDGFVDLQVNGYAGVDFNSDALTLDELRSACLRLRQDKVAGVLATIITADIEQMEARLRRIVAIRERDPLIREVIWGLHIEGPFISPQPGYVGAHPAQHVQPADLTLMLRLLDAASGLTRIVTLAPEFDRDLQVTQALIRENIVVSAGHCNPSMEQLRAAIDVGLSMFTHLGNGCAKVIDRHDNVIQRVLSLSDELWITFIADGVHIPFYVLRNYLRIVGLERAIIVTDATAAAGMSVGRISIGNLLAEVGADGVPRLVADPQYLAGSALTMQLAADNLRSQLHLSQHDIKLLCQSNPMTAFSH